MNVHYAVIVVILCWCVGISSLEKHHMYDNDKNVFPLCPITESHTKLYFDSEDRGRDPAGLPCVLHLSNSDTLAHAFDTHGHFKGVLVEEIDCKRKYVGKTFSKWTCNPIPPLPTALEMEYRVHCIHENEQGELDDFEKYYEHRYTYSLDLFSNDYSPAALVNTLNFYTSSIISSVNSVSQSLSKSPADNIQKNPPLKNITKIHKSNGDEITTPNPAYEIPLTEEGLPDRSSELMRVLPATFCSITYAMRSNHYYLYLLAISSVWIFFPVATILLAIVMIVIHSLERKAIEIRAKKFADERYPQHTNNVFVNNPCEICFSLCRSTCVTMIFCIVNVFIYMMGRAVLDIYSYADTYTATWTVIVQYGLWALTSIIYLWSLPSYSAVVYNVIPYRFRQMKSSTVHPVQSVMGMPSSVTPPSEKHKTPPRVVDPSSIYSVEINEYSSSDDYGRLHEKKDVIDDIEMMRPHGSFVKEESPETVMDPHVEKSEHVYKGGLQDRLQDRLKPEPDVDKYK